MIRRALRISTRKRVLRRDGYRCQASRLGFPERQSHELDEKYGHLLIHHIVPVAHDGGNEDDNLVTLCGQHHRVAHEILGSYDGQRFSRLAAERMAAILLVGAAA